MIKSVCEIERRPASTPFISLTTLTTLGGGGGCGVRCNSGFVFWGSGAWGNSKTFDLGSLFVCGVRGGLGGLGGGADICFLFI